MTASEPQSNPAAASSPKVAAAAQAVAAPAGPPPPWSDAAQPGWRVWIHQFAENWIFAFLITMAIRHFLFEMFIIPTTSMEPMMYGDRGWFQGDFVVVNKAAHQFSAPSRFDVTVFQFPRDELFRGGISTTPAVDEDGVNHAMPFLDPLTNRNFVKRALVFPGETWFIRYGNLYLRSATGTFTIARKPDAIQNALWYRTYRSGAQGRWDQMVWSPSASSSVTAAGAQLTFTLGDGAIAFTQPLTNMYLKPGRVRVTRPGAKLDSGVIAPDPDKGTVSPENPLMLVGTDIVNLWDASRGDAPDAWQIARMKTEDIDKATFGAALNPVISEPVGDWRWTVAVKAISGSAAWTLAQAGGPAYTMTLAERGWSVTGPGLKLNDSTAAIAGHALSFAIVDDEVIVGYDGAIVGRQAIPPWRDLERRSLAWTVHGQGQLTASADLERDLHWSQMGIFSAKRLSECSHILANPAADQRQLANDIRDALMMRLPYLRVALPRVDWPTEAALRNASLETLRDLLAQALRAPAQALGVSPETALTAPADGYLLLGDNSPHSDDSRNWGYVPAANLRGRAIAVVFPPQRWRVIR